MRKYLLLLPVLGLILTGCQTENIEKLVITSDDDDYTITIGDSLLLHSNIENTIFTSKNNDIITLNQNEVIANQLGSADILCINPLNEEDVVSITIDVVPNYELILTSLQNEFSFSATLDYIVSLNDGQQEITHYDLVRLQNDNRYYVGLKQGSSSSSKTDYLRDSDDTIYTNIYDNHNTIKKETILNGEGEPALFDANFINPFYNFKIDDLSYDNNFNLTISAYDEFIEDFSGLSLNGVVANNLNIKLDKLGNPISFSIDSELMQYPDGSTVKVELKGEFKSKEDLGIIDSVPYPDNPETEILKTLFSRLAKESYSFTYTDTAKGYEPVHANGRVTDKGIALYTPEENIAYIKIDDQYYYQTYIDDENKTLTSISEPLVGSINNIRPSFDFSEDLFNKSSQTYTLLDAYDFVKELCIESMFTDNYAMIEEGSFKINFDESFARIVLRYNYNFLGQLEGSVEVVVTSLGNASWTYGDYEIIEYNNREAWLNFDSQFTLEIEEYIGYSIDLIPFYNIPGGWSNYQFYGTSNLRYVFFEKACYDMEEMQEHVDAVSNLLNRYGWEFLIEDSIGEVTYTHQELPNIEVAYNPDDGFGFYFFTFYIYNMNLLQ